MKYRKVLAVLAIVSLLPAAAWGVVDSRSLGYGGGGNRNPHNLSRQSENANGIRAINTGDPYETQICVFCHTPHGATPQTPLWNRPSPDTMGNFPTFADANVQDPSGNLGINDTSPTNIQNITRYGLNSGSDEYPNGASKLCLSCHDGVTAIGTLANGRTIQMAAGKDTLKNAGSTFYWDPVTPAGMDFSKTHPVSFVYTQQVVDYLNTFKEAGHLYVLPSPVLLDSNNRMQCTTCHDPHLDTKDIDNFPPGTYTLPFWRNRATANVGLDYENTCVACHESYPGWWGGGGPVHNITN